MSAPSKKVKPKDKGGGANKNAGGGAKKDQDASTAKTEEGLLPGWIKMRSRSKQQDYYYNPKLKVSQWKKPTIDDEIAILKKQEDAKDKKSQRERTILIAQRRLVEREEMLLAEHAESVKKQKQASRTKSNSGTSQKRTCDLSDSEPTRKKTKNVKKATFESTFSTNSKAKKRSQEVLEKDDSSQAEVKTKTHQNKPVKVTMNKNVSKKQSKVKSKLPATKVFSDDSDSEQASTSQPSKAATGLPKDRNKVNSSLQNLKDSLEKKKNDMINTLSKISDKFQFFSKDAATEKEEKSAENNQKLTSNVTSDIYSDTAKTTAANTTKLSSLRESISPETVTCTSSSIRDQSPVSWSHADKKDHVTVIPDQNPSQVDTKSIGLFASQDYVNSLWNKSSKPLSTSVQKPVDHSSDYQGLGTAVSRSFSQSSATSDTSMVLDLHSTEEDMEVEAYPEEYLKLLTDISGVREDLRNHEVDMSGPLTESFLEARTDAGVNSGIVTKHAKTALYVVIDTNVLLNSLTFVSSLKVAAIQGHTAPCIVIPWVVMTELDFIKDNKKNLVTESTQIKARSAVKYLHDHLEQRHPQLIGQKPSEAAKKFDELGNLNNNDDKVLQCCLQWKDKYSLSLVMLLTGDVHLRSKAMILGIPVHGEKSMQTWIAGQKNSTTVSQLTYATTSSVVTKTADSSVHNKTPVQESSVQPTPSKRFRKKSKDVATAMKTDPDMSHMTNVREKIVLDVRRHLQECLGALLENNMKNVYQELWTSIVFRPKPWSLEDILESLRKHWIAVFGDIFGRDNTVCVDVLLDSLRKTKSLISWDDVQDVVDNSLQLCERFLMHCNHYSLARLSRKLQKLHLVIQAANTQGLSAERVEEHLQDITKAFPSPDSDMSIIVDLIQETFQTVWEMILAISTKVKSCLQAIGDPSRHQNIKEFSVFCGKVAVIHRKYSTMISMSPDANRSTDEYSAICEALEGFALHYGIQEWRGVSPELLKVYDNESRRLVLQNGFAQLENLMGNISECNTYLTQEESMFVQNSINEVTGIT